MSTLCSAETLSDLARFICFLDSNLLQSAVTFLAFLAALWVGYKQNKISQSIMNMQDVVEIYATTAHLIVNGKADPSSPVIKIQNVGTRLLYLDKYIFNGVIYELKGQIIPSTYSNAEESFYRIGLPNGGDKTAHVSVQLFYRDIEGKKWKSSVMVDAINGFWAITHAPKERDFK